MERTLRILWHSNAPHAPTGYGNQTHLFVERLAYDFDMTLSCFYGLQGEVKNFRMVDEEKGERVVTALPGAFHPYGDDILQAHMAHTKADVCLTLIDPFALHPDTMKEMRWCSWVPVDCAPLSDENARTLTAANHLWSMSRFGHTQLQQFVDQMTGDKPTLHYVPHGIDSKAFAPKSREDARGVLGKHWSMDVSDKFVVATVAANKGYPGRKNFPGMFMTMAPFLMSHPDAVWYLHTGTFTPGMGADDIKGLVAAYGLEKQVILPGEYQYIVYGYPTTYLNDVYNAADVFLLMSFGEGFGIPIMEAQMAGCPVIVTDGTSMSELCLAGDKIPAMPIQALDGRQKTLWANPSHGHALALLDKHYQLWKVKDSRLRTEARQKALVYDVDSVYSTYMKPAVEAITEAVMAGMSDSRKRRKRSSMQPVMVAQPNGDKPQQVAEKSA